MGDIAQIGSRRGVGIGDVPRIDPRPDNLLKVQQP
jgi:hypothetical protein